MTLTDELLATSEWSDDDVAAAGLPVVDVPIVTVGGGLGSFAFVDTLRIAGVPADDIAVLSDLDHPWQTYEYLASNSQIPAHERLRSDSGSTIDCIWGWPGYALRESVADRSPRRAAQVLNEPIIDDYYTPRAAQVYSSVEREAERIGWTRMLHRGVVRTIRKRSDGGYFVVHTPDGGGRDANGGIRRVVYRSQHAHIAIGYPGVRFLPDLQEFRETYDERTRVVNAYEPHLHVYEELERRPCTVVLRGAGIVASRIIQRIVDDRDRLATGVTILHLFRNYPDGPEGDSLTFRRPASKGWAYQGFNYPKAAWGGQLRDRLESLDGPARASLLRAMGGTNTAPRADWREQLERGAREGFYHQLRGTLSDIAPTGDGRIRLDVATPGAGTPTVFEADFVIDATGLEADITEHRVLADLLEHVGARTNPAGRLDVDRDFSVRGAESGPGRLAASGSITLGGYYAGVDSFLGLQYAALRIADSLSDLGVGHKIGPLRSIVQWWKWARKEAI